MPFMLHAGNGDSGGFVGSLFFSSTETSSDLSSSTTVKSFMKDIDEEKKLNEYVDANYDNIQDDAASGRGEYIDTLYELGDFKEYVTKPEFLKLVQNSYDDLFSRKDSSYVFVSELRKVVSDSKL